MLHLFYSNRHETLADALLDDLAAFPARGGPWAKQQIIVPSAALRRRLELDIAERHGVCANVEFTYLAQWLWAQIGRVLTVPARSPFGRTASCGDVTGCWRQRPAVRRGWIHRGSPPTFPRPTTRCAMKSRSVSRPCSITI